MGDLGWAASGVASDWVDAEFANLRTGFRWATDRHDLDSAVAIAAHTTLIARYLQRYEPIAWAEELLPAATAADVSQLPRLYVAAAGCMLIGRPEASIEYAQTAQALETDPRYQPFGNGWSRLMEYMGHIFGGRFQPVNEIATDMATQTGFGTRLGTDRTDGRALAVRASC